MGYYLVKVRSWEKATRDELSIVDGNPLQYHFNPGHTVGVVKN